MRVYIVYIYLKLLGSFIFYTCYKVQEVVVYPKVTNIAL